MEKDDKRESLFNEINSIINKEQTEQISSYTASFIRNNPLFNDEIVNPGNSKFNYSYNSYLRKHSPIYAGKYILNFCPERKKLDILLDEKINVKFFYDPHKNISLEIKSSGKKNFNFQGITEKNIFIKFVTLNFIIILMMYGKKIFLMIFDMGKIKIEEDILLFSSRGVFKLYVNKEVLKTKNQRDLNIKPLETYVIPPVPPVGIELGRGLLALADPNQGALLLERVSSIKRHIKLELGMNVPPVRFRDNLMLKPNSYIIKLNDVEVAAGEVIINKFLAIGPENHLKSLKGTRCFDPTYGMPSVWITADQRGEAEDLRCMIFDPVSVMATQITEVIRTHSHELINRQEIINLLSEIEETYPAIVEEIQAKFTPGEIQAVLKNLLREQVPIKNLVTILETMADYSSFTKDTDLLTEHVRQNLSLTICSEYVNSEGNVWVITLEKKLEKMIALSVEKTEYGSYLVMSPETLETIISAIIKKSRDIMNKGCQPILLCSPLIRPHVKRLMEKRLRNLVVLSCNEIPAGFSINYLDCVVLKEEEYKKSFEDIDTYFIPLQSLNKKKNSSDTKKLTIVTTCRKCKSIVSKDANYCNFCGEVLSKKMQEEHLKRAGEILLKTLMLETAVEKKPDNLKEKVKALIIKGLDFIINYFTDFRNYLKKSPQQKDTESSSEKKERKVEENFPDCNTEIEKKIVSICLKADGTTPAQAIEALEKYKGDEVKAILFLKTAIWKRKKRENPKRIFPKVNNIIKKTDEPQREVLNEPLTNKDKNIIKYPGEGNAGEVLKNKILEVIKNNIKKNRKKINYICRAMGISEEEALKVLLENDGDEKKAVKNVESYKENLVSAQIAYICRRAKVSPEEAREKLIENDYDEIEAVLNIKKMKRRQRREPDITEKNIIIKRLDFFSEKEIIHMAGEILKNNMGKNPVGTTPVPGIENPQNSKESSVNKNIYDICHKLDTTPEMKKKVKEQFTELKNLMENTKERGKKITDKETGRDKNEDEKNL